MLKGYLSHLLFQNFGHQVLGLEVCKKFIDQAYKTQENLYPSCKNNVIFSELFVQIDSEKTIESLIEKHFGKNRRICLTGLHACADLSVTVLKLFSKMECVKALSIMPCCYHRTEVKEEMPEKTIFTNFPCSRTLKDIFERFEGETYLGTPFLRLACQDTYESFLELSEKDLETKTQALLFRAVLEFVAEDQNCTVKRLKRKSGKLTTTDGGLFFETHLNNLPSCHRLLAAPSSIPRDIDEPFLMEMRRKWEEYHTNITKRLAVSVYIALQALIQSVCENVVLVDRIEMVREYGYSCRLKRITDSKLSPRCWALVAVKDIQ
ncbi:protein RRNAD1-like [Sitophilus oryzae]|uniref:Protein RRNAD1-like n=1 Tax=Sitophilus oryzae TaxID=7048 RepID=A0A6J2YU82_SITOR|nr:protein RRNAD1-like [Sitophilus oryzae]